MRKKALEGPQREMSPGSVKNIAIYAVVKFYMQIFEKAWKVLKEQIYWQNERTTLRREIDFERHSS